MQMFWDDVDQSKGLSVSPPSTPQMHLLSLSLRPPLHRRQLVVAASKPPARDTIITFGKHKGHRLGSLPSSYLRWVSTTLRAGETERWARLVDAVLSDPVYRDRIEWEIAARLLSGDNAKNVSASSSVSDELLEVGERFGWDYADRDGWAKVDFALLGTSFGGRIPRKTKDGTSVGGGRDLRMDLRRSNRPQDEIFNGGGALRRLDEGLKVGTLRRSMNRQSADGINADEDGALGRREERRQRRRKKMQWEQMAAAAAAAKPKRLAVRSGSEKKSYGAADRSAPSPSPSSSSALNGSSVNPFPGRQGLLGKMMRLED